MTALDPRSLRAAAGRQSFERGQDYVPWVQDLEVMGSAATASIQARLVYLVELTWSGPSLRGHCTCPHHADGHFCKHLVALGLAVLAQGKAADVRDVGPERSRARHVPPPSRPVDPVLSAALAQDVARALRPRRDLDYRHTVSVARDAQVVLDDLQRLVDTGEARTAQEPLLRAVTRTRRLLERADDSAGALGDACQRAAELYAEACRAGHPAPRDLARWFLRFRQTSPGWPDLRLEDLVEAFDERALQIYRDGVERSRRGPQERVDGFELGRMRLELADHDGDVDAAVEVLAAPPHPRFGAIVERLRSGGRTDEASRWIDRAIEAGRVGSHHDDFHLSTDEVALDLLRRGRVDDALAVHRDAVRQAHDVRAYMALLDFAQTLGRREGERVRALGALREKAAARFGNGALLVQIALADRDLVGAWAFADEYGPGHAWQTLANASVSTFPARVAWLHRERLEPTLALAKSDTYPAVADAVATIGRLMRSAGQEAEYAEYVASLRERFTRRPALMAALDRRGL